MILARAKEVGARVLTLALIALAYWVLYVLIAMLVSVIIKAPFDSCLVLGGFWFAGGVVTFVLSAQGADIASDFIFAQTGSNRTALLYAVIWPFLLLLWVLRETWELLKMVFT